MDQLGQTHLKINWIGMPISSGPTSAPTRSQSTTEPQLAPNLYKFIDSLVRQTIATAHSQNNELFLLQKIECLQAELEDCQKKLTLLTQSTVIKNL